ncbi:TetR family transcriptional regulator [Catenovulum sp. 2E275]|uniref:TetR/AcrR family transcriptional regulator n=1 Tax=Catenovulum sp. 2E275 TaxID=2980497 RepID=UPI0021CFE38F|nr:TetR/AcrR family transcriptional regulator [Catenovulum sp. 2E275]MCU4676496.1 TetR family transcriptional regulator [Catenovulum sp. 2E275]
MKKIDTKTRILNAAEQLFAIYGFNNTSLRQITTEANVNLASVNYHFGSKKSLIQAVLARYLQVFMPTLITELDNLTAQQTNTNQLNLNDLLHTFVKPLLALNQISAQSARNFMVMIGRGYSETQGHLRRYISENYGETLNHIMQLFASTLPNISRTELFWRLHFSLGALVFTMTSDSALAEISESDFSEKVSTEYIVNKLIPFIVAGLKN